MRILVISDSHYHSVQNLKMLGYDYIIHCGDMSDTDYYYLKSYTSLIVCGNCDFNDEQDKFITIKNKKVFITHSHRYHSKSTYDYLVEHAKNIGADIVFFGHTHNRTFFQKDGITFINPGDYMSGHYVEITDNEVNFLDEPTGINDQPDLYERIEISLFK